MMSGGRREGGVGGWGGQKVLSRPSADSFAVGRRQKSGLSIKTMVITSIQRYPLSFWPGPFEVKQVAKMGEKYGKIWKI
jgi:hypothetical protein